MKRKIFSVLFALVLVCSLGLVMAGPVAADVSTPDVTLDEYVVSMAAEYTIVFHVNVGLSKDSGRINITFPADTTVQETGWVAGDITLAVGTGGANNVLATSVIVADVTTPITGRAVSFIIPVVVPADSTATVIFTAGADIKNPSTAGTYNLYVRTDAEAVDVISEGYDITEPPGPVDVYDAGDIYLTSEDSITLAKEVANAKTLKVHADSGSGGNYDSSSETYPLALDKAVTVESLEGAASTTIDASGEGSTTAAIEITISGVTLGSGVEKGFTIIAPDGDIATFGINRGIDISGDGVDTVTINGNVITGDTLSPQLGILIGAYPFNGHTEGHADIRILNNTFNTTWGYQAEALNPTSGGIKSAPGSTLSGTLTLIDNNIIPDFFVGINLCGPVSGETLSPVIISNNTVTGSDCNGIEVGGATIANLKICDNQIYDNGGNGVAISGESTPTNVKVEQNDIYNNGNGVKVYSGVIGGGISINYNDIYNNTNTTVADRTDFPDAWTTTWASYQNYGVWNATSAASDLDAMYNFWNDPNATLLDISGPDSSGATGEWAGTALGMGDIAAAVTGSTVIYNPWLTKPYADVIGEGIRYYGSDTLTLQAGWNTLSVPLKLYDYADTIAEIEDMGDFLTTANYSGMIYLYDSVEGWLTPPELVPCRGYYIKMLEDSRFPVLYSNSLGLPAFVLDPGWNLVGSAFGIDKDGTWAVDNPDSGPTEAVMKTGYALDSIGGQTSVVVSPSAPGQIGNPWSEIWVAGNTGNNMYTGEGYWVFMTDTGTLAGWEITPFYFTPGTIPD